MSHPSYTTLYHCPLCPWTHAVPPGVSADPVGALFEVEGALAAHVASHGLTEWVREVVRLQELLAAYRKVYDDGDAMDEAIQHLAACGQCDPVGYDHTLCDGYRAAMARDAERLRKEAG